jgi:CRISPR-associated endonuclease/helicase Cas3
MALAVQPALDIREVRPVLEEYKDATPEWLAQMLASPPKRMELDAYPSGGETPPGWILSGRFSEADAGSDESSAAAPVFLDRHLADVTKAVTEISSALELDGHTQQSLEWAAQLHDCGKADAHFQALLHGGDPMAAQFAPKLLAKGAQARQSREVRKAQWARSGLPDGFRHELVSLLLAKCEPENGVSALALHLIAAHHGRCRPFAPVVDDLGGDLAYNGRRIAAGQRISEAAHRLDSGVADRFWELTREYGWWGLAYLECLLRLADWKASKDEAAGIGGGA